jgi:FkbM family methyltransferase
MIMPISNGIFLKEQNIFKKILYYFPYYFFHKNYVFGCYFKFVTKDFIITFNKKKLVFKIPDNRFAISDLCCFFTKTYELNDAWLVKKYLKNDDYPIIIGGGIGYIATLSYHICKNKIIVFEIDKSILKILKKNLDYNNVKYKLYQKSFYIYKKPKIEKIYISKNFLENSKYIKQNNYIFPKSISLNKILKNNNKINTLIIDAEGYEYDVITSIKDKIFKKIFFELHSSIIGSEKTQKIFKVLKNNNYKLKGNFFNSYLYELN